MEFMDFQLYSLAAAIVFNEIFFPESDPAMGLIMAMGTYGAGYVARLVGAFVFGHVGDKMGRRTVLFVTITLMGLASTLIGFLGFLPTYSEVGIWAPAGLVALRIIQGLGAGAEISGAGVMVTEFCETKTRGLVGSLVGLGTSSGTLLANLIWTIILTMLTKEEVLLWGWRIPFYASFVVMIAAVLIRMFVHESPVMAEKKKLLEAEREKQLAGDTAAEKRPEELYRRPGPAFRPGRQQRPHADLPGRLYRHGPRHGKDRRDGSQHHFVLRFLLHHSLCRLARR